MTRVRCKQSVRLAAAAVLLVACCSSAYAQGAPEKRRVAVLDFEDDTGGSAAAAAFGADAGSVGKGISARIIGKLLEGGNYTLVDRSALKQVLEEQSRSEESEDPAVTAARIGRILGLDAMIVGRITHFGPEAAKQESSGHSGMSKRESKAYVEITCRVLEMTRGEAIAAFTVRGQSAHAGEIVRITAGGTHGHPKTTQEILGNEFVNSLLGEASEDAAAKMATELNEFAGKIAVLHAAVDGLVAEIAEDRLTLNVGKNSGLKVGDKLKIVRDIRTVKDPATGAALAPVVEQVGEATVIEVEEEYATAKFSGAGQVRVGDRVKAVP